MSDEIRLPVPSLQIGFASALKRFRVKYLQGSLTETMGSLDVAQVDQQLARFVRSDDLAALAGYGLRAELLFAVPIVLRSNPFLLGYYRLLLGFSQKEFYGADKGLGIGQFKSMEEHGQVRAAASLRLDALCYALCGAASALLTGLGAGPLTRELLDDLTLLTLGPQLRGGANNARGSQGIIQVFGLLREIVGHAVTEVSDASMEVTSATGRLVSIKFAADPDIVIIEQMEHGKIRNVVAIEVKSGTDIANVHNRIGEAEKSHQKARKQGFTECWTVLNVSRFDLTKAKGESPSTDRFYSLASLVVREGDEYLDFRRRVQSLTSISAPRAPKRRSR